MLATPVARPVEIFVDTRGAQIIDEEGSPDQRDSRDIYLPNHVESVSHIAVDIGGSLAKVVYFTRTLASSSATGSPQIGTHALEPEMFHDRLTELQAQDSPRRTAFHSRESSSDHAFAMPRSPSSSGFLQGNGRSGTLTPTAVLRERIPSASTMGYVPAMHSSFLKRRSLPPALPGGRLNFIKFETEKIHECVAFLKELIDRSAQAHCVSNEQMRKGVQVMATGGGAHMYYDLFERELGVEVRKEDEMGCLITGLNFITLIPNEVFWYSDELVSALQQPHASTSSATLPKVDEPLPRPSPNPPLYAPAFDTHPSPKLPCLLVNIGSGVSIIKVDDYGKFERVSGTSLGGGTLWGLLSLLTDAGSFDEMLELSESGDNASVDMLVGDIYGSGMGANALNSFGLKSSTIASSFGKVFRKDGSEKGGAEGRKRKFKPEDICRSLLYAISNNIGQIAYMNAEKYDLDRIYFGGCFIRGHRSTISTLSYAIRFWSKGTKRAFFLRHEGYLGAIGAWIKHISVSDIPPLQQTQSATREQGMAADLPSPSQPASVTALTDSAATPLVSPSGSQLEGQSLGGHSLPSMLADALSPLAPSQAAPNGAASPATSPSPNGQVRSSPSSPVLGVAAAPALSRIPSEREVESQRRPNGHVAAEGTDDSASEPLDQLIASLSPSDREILAPVLKELDGLSLHGDSLNGDSGDGSGQDAQSMAELLLRLEAADVAADGLESKLDTLLAQLDGVLGGGSPQPPTRAAGAASLHET